MRRIENIFSLVLAILLAFLSASWAETIFESFDSNPYSGQWSKVGSECTYDYHTDGYLTANTWKTVTDQRFSMPLSSTYNEATEFWLEFDWKPESVYEWPRAYLGVFSSSSDNKHNVLGAYYQRRNKTTGEQRQRLIGLSSDGTSIVYKPGYVLVPGNYDFTGRTKLHYYRNAVGEGIIEIEIYNVTSDTLLISNSAKVLDAGKAVSFDKFGFANSLTTTTSNPQYDDIFLFDNLYFSTEFASDDYFAGLGQSIPSPSWAGDIAAPSPDPMTWSSVPSAVKPTWITMTATTATDDTSSVQYYFLNITDPSHFSGWQDGTTWTDKNLEDNTEYYYQVQARDMSLNHNVTEWSASAGTTTPVETDVTSPDPDPATWAAEPALMGLNTVTMTADTAVDGEDNVPVEYFFANVTDASHNSGWQESPVFVDEGLLFETEYIYRVRSRDSSANHNESLWSSDGSIVTLQAPSILAYSRKSMIWDCENLGIQVPLDIYYIDETTGGDGAVVVVYVKNHIGERIGQEPDESILSDLVSEGYIVITADFGNDPGAVSPVIDLDLNAIFKGVYGEGTTSLLADVGLSPTQDLCYFLPAGYRIEMNIPYWNRDTHGVYGTKEWVMGTYNDYIMTNFGKAPVTDPYDMEGPNGEEFDWNIYLNIVYPSHPNKKVPVVVHRGSISNNAPYGYVDGDRSHFMGLTMRGYAFVSMAHNYNPIVNYYGHFNSFNLDYKNGLASSTAGVRWVRAHADEYGYDSNLIGEWGHSKGQYGVLRLSDPNHANTEEHSTYAGFPPGTPEPQPWQGYSSELTCAYQSFGVYYTKYLTSDTVPTVVACSELDEYGHWPEYPPFIKDFEDKDINHIAFWMLGLKHTFATGYDPVLDLDRYDTTLDFFDQYLKVNENLPPKVLYILPIDGGQDILLDGYSPSIPDASRLEPANALDYVSQTAPITVHFAPNMEPASIADGVEIRRVSDNSLVEGVWTAMRKNTMFMFAPTEDLMDNESYTIEVTTTVKNEAGTYLDSKKTVEFRVKNIINFDDLHDFCSVWLNAVTPGSGYDFDGSGVIDLLDYAYFANIWMTEF